MCPFFLSACLAPSLLSFPLAHPSLTLSFSFPFSSRPLSVSRAYFDKLFSDQYAPDCMRFWATPPISKSVLPGQKPPQQQQQVREEEEERFYSPFGGNGDYWTKREREKGRESEGFRGGETRGRQRGRKEGKEGRGNNSGPAPSRVP